MRLIDADALEAKLEEQRKLYIEMDMKGAEHLLVHDVLDHVWEAPTIDAVPVVRCKNCKWSEVYQVDSDFPMERWCDGGFIPKSVQDDDYCSFGERKDDETD